MHVIINIYLGMSKIAQSLILALFPLFLFASEINIEMSAADQKYIGNSPADEIKIGKQLFRTEGHYKKQWELVAYDTETQSRKIIRTLCKGKAKNGNILPISFKPYDFLLLNGKLYILYVQAETKKKFYALHAQEISFSGQPIGDLIQLKSVSMPNSNKKNYFNSRICADSTKFIVWNNSDISSTDNKTSFSYLLYEKGVTSPEVKKVDISVNLGGRQIKLLNDGSIFLTGWKKMTATPGWIYNFVAYNPATGDMKKTEAKFPNKGVYSIVYTINADQKTVHFGGLAQTYGTKPKKTWITGAFSGVANLQTGKTSTIDYHKFSTEFVTKVSIDPILKKVKDGEGKTMDKI